MQFLQEARETPEFIHQTSPLTTSSKCHNLPHSGAVLITPGGHSIDSTRQKEILVRNHYF